MCVSESRLPQQTQSCSCATAFELGREVDTGQVRTDEPRYCVNLQLLIWQGFLRKGPLPMLLSNLCSNLFCILNFFTWLTAWFPLGPVSSTHHTLPGPAYSTASYCFIRSFKHHVFVLLSNPQRINKPLRRLCASLCTSLQLVAAASFIDVGLSPCTHTPVITVFKGSPANSLLQVFPV